MTRDQWLLLTQTVGVTDWGEEKETYCKRVKKTSEVSKSWEKEQRWYNILLTFYFDILLKLSDLKYFYLYHLDFLNIFNFNNNVRVYHSRRFVPEDIIELTDSIIP